MSNPILRTVNLTVEQDDRLKREAYYLDRQRNDLMVEYLEAGMKVHKPAMSKREAARRRVKSSPVDVVNVVVESSRRFGRCTLRFTHAELPEFKGMPFYYVQVMRSRANIKVWQRDDGEWYFETNMLGVPHRGDNDGYADKVICQGGSATAPEAWQKACGFVFY